VYFMGYRSSHKGYKCLDVVSGCVYVSRDVMFDEGVFPFSSLHPNSGAQLHSDILLLPPPLRNSYEGEFVATGRTNGANVVDPLVEPHVQGEEFIAENSLAPPGIQASTSGAATEVTDGGATLDPSASISDLP
jgi:hypothetical protein